LKPDFSHSTATPPLLKDGLLLQPTEINEFLHPCQGGIGSHASDQVNDENDRSPSCHTFAPLRSQSTKPSGDSYCFGGVAKRRSGLRAASPQLAHYWPMLN
jgi:hypothetical protein